MKKRFVLYSEAAYILGLVILALGTALMEKALPMITTDMTNRQILDYLTRIVPMLGSMKVATQQIPAEGTYKYAYIREMSVLLPDLEKNREILKKIVE